MPPITNRRVPPPARAGSGRASLSSGSRVLRASSGFILALTICCYHQQGQEYARDHRLRTVVN